MAQLPYTEPPSTAGQRPPDINSLYNSTYAVERNFTPLQPDTSLPLPKYLYTVEMIVGRLMYWWRSLFGFGRTRYYMSERFQRARVVKLLSYEKGMYKGYLEDLIDATFSNSMEGSQLKKWAKIYPIVAYLCDQVAMSFKNGVTVTANNPAEQPIYNQILDSINLDSFMKQIERLVFLVKTVMVKVGYDQEDGKILLVPITPEKVEAEVDPENTKKLTRITYALTDLNPYWYTQSIMVMAPLISGLPMRLASWTKNDYFVLDAAGHQIYNEENTQNVNPYGILPFVRFRETQQYDTNYLQWPGDELENAQDAVNMLSTELQYLFSMQSFSIPVLVNPDKEMFDVKTGRLTFEISPGKPIIFTNKDQASQPADFRFVSPSPHFKELQEALDRTILQILSMYGINVAEMVPSSQRQSGNAMEAAERLLNERRDKMKLMYTEGLNSLFEIIRVVWNTYNPDQKLSDAGVNIDIHESNILKLTVDDQIKMAEFRMENGFSSVIDEMLAFRNDLTREEALSAIQQNIQINKQYGATSTSTQTPSIFSQMLGSVSGATKKVNTESLTGSPGGPGGVSTPNTVQSYTTKENTLPIAPVPGKINFPPIPGGKFNGTNPSGVATKG